MASSLQVYADCRTMPNVLGRTRRLCVLAADLAGSPVDVIQGEGRDLASRKPSLASIIRMA